MSTRKLKFTGNIGSTNSEVEILINDQLVYSGPVGVGTEVTPSDPTLENDLVTVSFEGKEEEDETVSVIVNVTRGNVRIGPIYTEVLTNQTKDTKWLRYYSNDTGDGRTNISVNGFEKVSSPEVNAWNGWFFDVFAPMTFSCNLLVKARKVIYDGPTV